MKRFAGIAAIVVVLFSCTGETGKGKFAITGEIKNAPDQKIYLEELFFSTNRNPEVLDTAEIKNGKFTTGAMANEEGLYRIRLEKSKEAFIFINDRNEIETKADYNTLSFKTISFNTPANNLLKNFITGAGDRQEVLGAKATELQQYGNANETDSLYAAKRKDFEDKFDSYKKFIVDNIDTTGDPIVALFAMGYTREVEADRVTKLITNLGKRFPKHKAVKAMIARYNEAIQQAKQEEQAQSTQTAQLSIGSMAPDFTLPDTSGKLISLSSFKGKYVLVDFWASWCAPCRAANPGLVNAYNTFKEKNFTILGVSLDKSRNAWLQAIQSDGLLWTQISDLKYWGAAVVNLYGLEEIPFNALVDPQGKIIAINLVRGELQAKLTEVLK